MFKVLFGLLIYLVIPYPVFKKVGNSFLEIVLEERTRLNTKQATDTNTKQKKALRLYWNDEKSVLKQKMGF